MNSDRPPSSTVRDRPAPQGGAGCRDERGVELRRAEAPVEPPIVAEDQLAGRRRALAGLVRTELARRRVGGQRRDDRRAVTARPDRPAGRLDDHGRHDRLDEHVDGAAAGETHVPGLLVADPVADDAGVPGRAGLLDLLGRRALDAAAADRADDPAVVAYEQHGALRARRGPERANDDGPADVGAGGPRPARSRACRAAPSSQWPRSGPGRWSHHRRRSGGAATAGPMAPGQRRDVRGGLAAAPRVAGPDAAEDLAEPLEAGDRAGRQEVVDVRVGGRASRRRAAGSRPCRPAG